MTTITRNLASVAILLILWVLLTWNGLSSAVEIWWGNEIFNHGFFIIPGSLYLLYLERQRLFSETWTLSYLPLPFVIGACLLYVIGVAGDIQLFMHVATFTLLPLLIWTVIGNSLARMVWFPLVFILFSIPIGEELIPYLQEIAADGSVAMLQMVGIPLYRNGLYIEIPQGRFLVAEACSGVSFFIASFVIGSVYSHLNFNATYKKVGFVVFSLVLPIAANIVRIFGIIVIGYLSDMEHAVGADHLVYGWFFFAFVIICLLGVGELVRDKTEPDDEFQSTQTFAVARTVGYLPTYLILFLSTVWVHQINRFSNHVSPDVLAPIIIDSASNCDGLAINVSPIFKDANVEHSRGISLAGECVGMIHRAWFTGQDNELVSSLNRPYDHEKWNLLNIDKESVDFAKLGTTLQFLTLTSPSGQKRFFSQWYEVDGHVFTSSIEAKLYQIYLRLTGNSVAGYFVVVEVKDAVRVNDLPRMLIYSEG